MILDHVQIGVGTWAWGNSLIWGSNLTQDRSELTEVFQRLVRDGLTYFATSESFAEGECEKLIGTLARRAPVPIHISTKYTPRIWRISRRSFRNALKGSLQRLGLSCLDLYEILPPVGRMELKDLAECAAEALDMGLVREVGISNFSARQIDIFNECLGRLGYAIGCHEVEYNLLNREIEHNGVMKICRELNIPIIAQNPLAMGVLCFFNGALEETSETMTATRRKLTEKYSAPYVLEYLQRSLNRISLDTGGRSNAQIALNWLRARGVIPLPGIHRLRHAIDNAQVPHWQLTSEQIALLDDITSRSVFRTN